MTLVLTPGFVLPKTSKTPRVTEHLLLIYLCWQWQSAGEKLLREKILFLSHILAPFSIQEGGISRFEFTMKVAPHEQLILFIFFFPLEKKKVPSAFFFFVLAYVCCVYIDGNVETP